MKISTFVVGIAFASVSVLLFTCRNSNQESSGVSIVRVENEVLTSLDLRQVLPADVGSEDSAAMADDYVNRWVNSKLFLRQAELNLTDQEKDVSQLLDEYRTSLLVNIYQQKMLEQKYSPLLNNDEIQEYYEEMQDNFKLQENILQGIMIRIPLNAPNQNKLRRWFRSANTEDFVEIENYCIQYGQMHDSFLDSWIPFQRINANLPDPIKNEERFLLYNKYYETTDQKSRFFLLVTDYATIGNTAPLSYVEDRIKAILLNKKRGEFIKSLEKELYDEALQKKIINFY